MAKVFIDETTLTSIADAIREAKGTTELIPTLETANEVTEVYEAGKKAEYDAFWDSYQNKGKRTHYGFAFSGQGWNQSSFKPKYDLIVVNDGRYMFAYGALASMDLTQHLESIGITLDTSQCTNFNNMFNYGSPYRVPVLDTTSANALNQISYYSSVATFDKIILRSDGSQTFSNTFIGTKIVNLTLEGVIGQNGFNLQWSTNLSKASIESIINALSTTTNGLTVTLSKTAKEAAFTADEWSALIATRPNWTISLV